MFTRAAMISLQVEGTHQWANCDLPNVAYLSDRHRHMFQIRCWFHVEHNNRDIEFIDMKQRVKAILSREFFDEILLLHNFKTMSCEDISEWILLNVSADGYPIFRVEVLEDGENGAILEFIKECLCKTN